MRQLEKYTVFALQILFRRLSKRMQTDFPPSGH